MDFADYTDWLAFLATLSTALIGVVLTVFLLPGAWFLIAVMAAIGIVWKPELITSPWWTFGIAVVIAITGELLELFAGAYGARKGGGSRTGAVAAVFGAIFGAVIGAPLFFPFGSLILAILFAGSATVAAERFIHRKQWEESTRAGIGAAIGRALATVAKVLCTVAVGIVFTIAVLND